MRTNDQIFQSIKETGFITESDLQLLKNRSNKAQKDVFNYDILDEYEIRITPEQGLQGLTWLQGFLKKDGTPRKNCPFGYREMEIVKNASVNDFTFRGFYDAGNGWHKNYLPVYELNGMEYIPKWGECYIIG